MESPSSSPPSSPPVMRRALHMNLNINMETVARTVHVSTENLVETLKDALRQTPPLIVSPTNTPVIIAQDDPNFPPPLVWNAPSPHRPSRVESLFTDPRRPSGSMAPSGSGPSPRESDALIPSTTPNASSTPVTAQLTNMPCSPPRRVRFAPKEVSAVVFIDETPQQTRLVMRYSRPWLAYIALVSCVICGSLWLGVAAIDKDASKEIMKSTLVGKQIQIVLSLIWGLCAFWRSWGDDDFEMAALYESKKARRWLVLYALSVALHEVFMVRAYIADAPALPYALCIGGPSALSLAYVLHGEAFTVEVLACVWGVAAHVAICIASGSQSNSSELWGAIAACSLCCRVMTSKYLSTALPHDFLTVTASVASFVSSIIAAAIWFDPNDTNPVITVWILDDREKHHIVQNVTVGLLLLLFNVFLLLSSRYIHEVGLTVIIQLSLTATWVFGVALHRITSSTNTSLFDTGLSQGNKTDICLAVGCACLCISVACVIIALRTARSKVEVTIMESSISNDSF